MECKTVQIKSTHPESQGPFVEINAGDFNAEIHERYVAPPRAVLPPPPPLPPPPAPDALVGLPAKWRELKPADMRTWAERATGRTPTSRDEAVQMIEAALAARK